VNLKVSKENLQAQEDELQATWSLAVSEAVESGKVRVRSGRVEACLASSLTCHIFNVQE
jgi:hypothetical protein